MNFLRHLRAAWNYAKLMPYKPEAEGLEWTDEDRAAYTHFMEHTPTGQKFRIMAVNRMNQIALNATQAHTNLAYQCGLASGVRATFFWMDSHLQLSPAEAHSAPEQSDPAAADYLERLAA